MATGAGKTYTAVTQAYRLLKHGGFNRILFLVDRNNLADQTLAEFQNYRTPGRRPPVHRDLQRRQAHQRRHARLLGRGDLDDPARVQGAPQRGRHPRRRSRPGRLRARRAGHRRLQPRHAAGDVRPGDRRRGPPLHLRRVARRAGLLRRPRRRPDRDAGQADVRVLPAEPRLRVHLPAVGRRQRERRLRPLPDPHRDQRAGQQHRGRHDRPEGRPPHPRPTARGARRGPGVHPQAARPGGHGQVADPHRAGDVPRPAVHRDLPRPLDGAEDADLRQGRRPRRGDRHHRPGGVRQGQRLRRQDHLQRQGPQGPAPGVPHQPDAADRGHRRHDRHRHRREAAGVRVLHARRPLGAVLRADEGPRRPHHRGGRLPGRHPRRHREDPLRHRRRRRRHRARLRRATAQPRQVGAAEEAARQGGRPHPHRGRDRHPRLPAGQARARAHPRRTHRARHRRRLARARHHPRTRRRRRPRRPGQAHRRTVGCAASKLIDAAIEPIAANPDLRNASSSCAPPTTASSTKSATTSCSTPTASSTPAAPSPSSSPGAPTSTSTAARSPPSSSSARPRTAGSRSTTSRNSPTGSPGRRTTGPPTSSGTPTSPSTDPRSGRPRSTP